MVFEGEFPTVEHSQSMESGLGEAGYSRTEEQGPGHGGLESESKDLGFCAVGRTKSSQMGSDTVLFVLWKDDSIV